MTAALDTEISELSELDLEGTPPCESILVYPRVGGWWRRPERVCGRPSAARVVVACHACGGKLRLFLCSTCLRNFQAGETSCRMCNARQPYDLAGES